MLGLPSLTIKSGPFPSSVMILLSWVYVISSILLVAELSFAAMEEDGVGEVSFSGLASKSLGNGFGALVAVMYASLSFALLVACVSGIGSLVSQWFPGMSPALACALFPLAAGGVMGFFPFSVTDAVNRSLCFLMLVSITSLVGIGLSVARSNVVNSFSHASWSISATLPAIPVIVLTLGFHVITPFICKVAGNSVVEARKAVLVGGVIPLAMVLSWNLIVLGLSWGNNVAPSQDPISLLLSVNASALPAVQGFAFSALATSLLGYAVSLPKHFIDTLGLIFRTPEESFITSQPFFHENGDGRVGYLVYTGDSALGSCGRLTFGRHTPVLDRKPSSPSALGTLKVLISPVILASSVLVASFFQSAFSRALAFAGVYANCFLFGILPPLMVYIQLLRGKLRSDTIPGGYATLLLLFSISVALGIYH
ncbi:hypothetical protein MLD38_020072 [Melastoma candidum]|uniref:Uncharacterized protein n=1 Tax=Melastoma candidum TaxID=119954 RepID=A0ACB9QBX7_9MYRT|nr:hypothetical protein MLD38_020072 [Melastoma candidum]